MSFVFFARTDTHTLSTQSLPNRPFNLKRGQCVGSKRDENELEIVFFLQFTDERYIRMKFSQRRIFEAVTENYIWIWMWMVHHTYLLFFIFHFPFVLLAENHFTQTHSLLCKPFLNNDENATLLHKHTHIQSLSMLSQNN